MKQEFFDVQDVCVLIHFRDLFLVRKYVLLKILKFFSFFLTLNVTFILYVYIKRFFFLKNLLLNIHWLLKRMIVIRIHMYVTQYFKKKIL